MNEANPDPSRALPSRRSPVSRRVVISGRVQGVYFRDGCRQVARRLGVRGWVRNLPDGTVEALFQGPEAAVREVVGWCGRGPGGAVVDAVTEHPTGAFEPLVGFEIRPTPSAW